ncbi:MAG TPA: hypothetical protein VF316_13300, partial [Polyangiaceae bacterium]
MAYDAASCGYGSEAVQVNEHEANDHDEVGSPEPFVAVVDTNVLLDIFSCHNVTSMYEKVGVEGVDSPPAVYRRARARESLLLAICFHKVGARTYSLHSEPILMLTKNVDPHDDTNFETHYAKIFANFVSPRVPAGWQPLMSDTPSHEAGNAADGAIVEFAKKKGLPLITNEGFTETGYSEGKIAKRAKAGGVSVFFPKDFCLGRMDEAA